MEIVFLKKFAKDIDKIKQQKDRQSILKIIESVKAAEGLEDIPNLKKLSGFDDAYRIRSGDYRIGIFYNEEVITFARVVHRKDIYKIFP